MLKKLRLWLIEKLADEDVTVTIRPKSKIYDYSDTVQLTTTKDKIHIETPYGTIRINTDSLTITTKFFPGKFQLIEKEVK